MGSITVKLPPHIDRKTAKGKVYYYYQPGRGTKSAAKPRRIPGEPTDPEWWEVYNQLAGKAPPAKRPPCFDELIKDWQASSAWRDLAPSTQREWNRHCKRIIAMWGELEVRAVEPQHVLAFQEKLSATPAEANNAIRCLSGLLSWSVPRGYRKDNPCREIKKLKIGEGYEPWPWEVVEQAEVELLPHLWHAAALAVYTGQRLGDVIAMKRETVKDGLIWVRQEKTRKELLIPVHHKLAEVMETIEHDAETIIANTRGKPWTASGFKSAWRKAKPALLKETGLVFHGLRKTAVITLLEVGCTDAEVASITGQSRRMIVHYARKVSQEKLARAAMGKWQGEHR